MRTGLVIIGAALAALGAGLILTLFFLSAGPTSTTQISTQDPDLPPGVTQSWVVAGPAAGSGSISLSWSASPAADVSLWPATTCSSPGGFCPTGVPALNWSRVGSGSGSISTASGSTYLLVVENPGTTTVRFGGILSVTYSPGTPVSEWSLGLIAAGGITLLTIGGIALFLGLYLPGGVYRDADRPPAAVRHPSLPPDEPEDEREIDDLEEAL